ncbi:MAG: hypothetical protein AAFV07_21010, partial [Bacteroidota bacterium]
MIQQIVGITFFFFSWCLAPAQEIIFADSFATNDNNWSLVQGRKLQTSLKEGYLEIRTKSAYGAQLISQTVPIPPDTDYEIRLQVIQTAGAKNMGFGLCWGAKRDHQDWQAFLISTNGKYTILDKKRDRYREIKRWTESRNVWKQDMPNELLIRKEGDRMYFFLNEKLAYVSAAIPLAGSDLGILV